jgi:hypothetical protein
MAAAIVALLVAATSAIGAEEFPAPVPPPFPNYAPSNEQDAQVSTATGPASAAVGDFALLSSLVTNHGSPFEPISFTDTVPAGLTITSVAAGSGTCTTSGQVVACRLSIESSASAPVNIVVTPTAAGNFENKASVAVASGQHDPVPSNNSAAATLKVAAAKAPAPTCTVPALSGTPLAVAKRVLTLLHCQPGKAKPRHSRSVRQGLVIRTTPKPGNYGAGRVVSLTVSSGPAKKGKGKPGR